MTAASSRTPRTPTYRDHTIPPAHPWERAADWHGYIPRHAADEHTPDDRTVPAIVERVR